MTTASTATWPDGFDDLELDVGNRLTDKEHTRLARGRYVSASDLDASPPSLSLHAVMECSPPSVWELLRKYDELPRHIDTLREATILRSRDADTDVAFEIKLPFPVGRLRWTNRIAARSFGDTYGIAWTLVDGELKANEGRLVWGPYRGDPGRTLARYQVAVQTKMRLPRRAERLATRWLLPRVVDRLRAALES